MVSEIFMPVKFGPAGLGSVKEAVLNLENVVYEDVKEIFKNKLDGLRIRCHGDYHLRNILFTGKDFVILNFEGEPARTWSEHRIKRSPLTDVATMLRSFHFAASFAWSAENIRTEDRTRLVSWKNIWIDLASSAFLNAYFEKAGENGLLPKMDFDRRFLLRFLQIERAFDELDHELNRRVQYAWIPIEAILGIFESK